MTWAVDYLPEAVRDMRALDGSARMQVLKAIQKVSLNPLPQDEGGFGKPLGNKRAYDLTGLLKIKLRTLGLRVVYRLVKEDEKMTVIVVGVRSDDEVYKDASKRREKHNL